MASRLAYAILIALAAHVAGAERVHARVAVPVAAADAVAAGGQAAKPAVAQSTLEVTDGGAPLPFLASNEGPAGEGIETGIRAVRVSREGERTEARPREGPRSARATTQARALALAYLDYSLALFQRRAGIPTNHTTAPPPNHS